MKLLRGTLGVAVKKLKTGEETTVNGDDVFQLASVFKVPVIVTLYRQADAGEIDLDERVEMTDYARVPGSGIIKELTPGLKMTIRDYRTLMMISDNTATDMVVGLVGKERVNDVMLELGLRKTKISTCRDLLFELAGMGDVDPEKRTIQSYYETMKKMQEGKIGRPRKMEMERDNVSTPVDNPEYCTNHASISWWEEIVQRRYQCPGRIESVGPNPTPGTLHSRVGKWS